MKKIILFIENGRMGNQLFQYHGLKFYFPSYKIIFIGSRALIQTFSGLDKIYFSGLWFNTFYFKSDCFRIFLMLLVKIGILGKIFEINENGQFIVRKKRGLIFNVFIVSNTYFQHKAFVNTITCVPKFNVEVIDEAKSWLNAKVNDLQERQLVFLHIRRTDYVRWPSIEFPAVMDLNWYRKAILAIKQKVRNPMFIIMGDDIFYIKDVFSNTENMVISENQEAVDLAIMSLCQHGILSASSFAWWGAFLSKNNNNYPNTSIYIAPKYWLGYRKGEQIPAGFDFNWLQYE